MKKEYDFSRARRGPVIPQSGKTRITIYLDDDILEAFRDRAESAGRGYQTLINDALRDHLGKGRRPVDTQTLRQILREELERSRAEDQRGNPAPRRIGMVREGNRVERGAAPRRRLR
jgi:hypothetical protein